MNGLHVNNSSSAFSVSSGDIDLTLLLRRPGIEVMTQVLKKDAVVWIDPADDRDTLEFFYVLSGELILNPDSEKQLIGEGGSFFADGLSEPVLIRVCRETRVLYLTNRPVFDDVLSFQGDFNELMHRVDEKDNYTYRHSSNVMNYSLLLFRRLSPDDITLDEITSAALFHDIGKCMVPDAILNKPGRLTDSEFCQIKEHPVFTSGLLRNRFGDKIADIALEHHERLDGSGYPLHLSGDEISLGSRIIAVADSFDAMTSKRVYTNYVKTFQEAADELCSMPDKYDSRVTAVLKELVESGEIYEVKQV